MNVRTVLGIILLIVCVLLVGSVALHWIGYGTPYHGTIAWESGFGSHSMVSPIALHRNVFSFFTLGGLGFLVLILGGIGLVLLLSGGGSKGSRDKALNGAESRIVQEIHEGLTRMERRVEALETIILEQTGRTSGYHEALDHER